MDKEIVVNGIKYVRERSATDDIRIVILHRGHVVVGRYERDGDEVTIRNASVIRVWGTMKGLGEIAAEGPTSKTVLDSCGVVRCHALAVIATLDCEANKWTSKVS